MAEYKIRLMRQYLHVVLQTLSLLLFIVTVIMVRESELFQTAINEGYDVC